MRRVAWLPALLPLIAALALSACGGSERGPSGVEGDSAGNPPAAPVATPTPDPSILKTTAARPTRPAQPAVGSDATLGGTPNRRAAAFVNEQLKAAGMQTGTEAFVVPLSGTHDELLVVEMNEAAGAVYPDDPRPLLKTLLTVQGLEIANVTRIAINYRGKDQNGPYVLTVTMPAGTASQYVSSAITDQQLLAEMRFELKQAAP